MQTQIVHSTLPWGVYVWQCADGRVLANNNGDVLSMNGFKGDLEAVRKMRDAATALGHGDGKAAFLPGSRKISQSEYEDQMAAYLDGDDIPGDIGDEERYL
jgi:hypothetical protein